MILAEEKIKYNFLIAIVTGIGLIIIEAILLILWFTVLGPGLTMALGYDFNYMPFMLPLGFTIFFAYFFGVILRGMEKQSHGLDLYNMDIAEIEIEIGLLEKEKRKREEAILLKEQEKHDKKKFKASK